MKELFTIGVAAALVLDTSHARAYGTKQFRIKPNGQIKEVESGKCLMALNDKDRAPVVLDACQNTPTEIWHFKD